jgi:hypothetical protein
MAMDPEQLAAPPEAGYFAPAGTWSAKVHTYEPLTKRASPSGDRLREESSSFGEAADLWAEAQPAASVAHLHEGGQQVAVVLAVLEKARVDWGRVN